jgi:hypothetical protein
MGETLRLHRSKRQNASSKIQRYWTIFWYVNTMCAAVTLLTNAGVMGSTWGRLSFILLMLQLFGTAKWRRHAVWSLFAVQVGFGTSRTFSEVFEAKRY